MTPEQIRILLRSLPTILAVREPAAACFHEHLLRLIRRRPSLRRARHAPAERPS